MSIAALGHDAEIDKLLRSIRTLGRKRGSEAQFSSDLDTLSRELAKSINDRIDDDTINVTTNETPPVFCDVLENLLTHPALDESVSGDAKQLQKQGHEGSLNLQRAVN